ncbi:MAG TPA: hypothetical protein VFM24_05045 [Nitrospira sp.]|nr:hypothetical protein [Nitrospira sp.]
MARQPEPDLEFTEEELDQTSATKPVSPMKPAKKSRGGRPLLWIVLLLLVAGIGYLAMEPEQLADWLAPFTGDNTPEPTAVATKPKPASPVTPPPPPMTTASTTPPSASEPAPSPGTPSGAPSSPPATPPPTAAAPAAPPASGVAVASPMFAEGQKVTAIGNPTAPAETIPLSLDPAGTKPGPVVRPGVTLSVLDGDLQPSGWVYSVRTDDGVKGWIPEKRLRLKF